MGQIPEPCAFYMTRTRKNRCCERAQRKRRIYRLGSDRSFAATDWNGCCQPFSTVVLDAARRLKSTQRVVSRLDVHVRTELCQIMQADVPPGSVLRTKRDLHGGRRFPAFAKASLLQLGSEHAIFFTPTNHRDQQRKRFPEDNRLSKRTLSETFPQARWISGAGALGSIPKLARLLQQRMRQFQCQIWT